MEKNRRNIKPFDGEKYSIWKFRIRALLSEANVIHVIDDEVPVELNNEWLKSEHIAKNLIVEYLSDSFLGFAKNESNAKNILKNLDAIYERKSLATQLAVRKKLLSLKLKGDESLLNHFTNFDDLITELLAAGAKIDEMDKVSHLLLTMPSSYDGVITAIETLAENNLNLAFVKTRLLDQEVKLKSDSRDTSAKVLSAIVEPKSRNKPHKFTKKINNKKTFKPYNKNKRVPNKQCYQCGRRGHMKADCIYYKKQQQYEQKEKQASLAVTTQPSSFAFMMTSNELNDKTSFMLDSGSTDHIINNINMFNHSIELNPPIKVAVAKSGQFVYATRKGIVKLTTNCHQNVTLQDVLFCKNASQNLLSVKKMTNAGMKITFEGERVKVEKDSILIFTGKYEQNVSISNFKLCYNVSTNLRNDVFRLWHERLGHISIGKFYELKSKEMFEDIDIIKNVQPNNSICESCLHGKQARLKFEKAKNKNHINRALFIIHSDVCGPISPPTVDGKNYYVVFIDQFTHYVVTYLITYKSEVFTVFKDYVAKCESLFNNNKIVHLYIDNGREYLSDDMKKYCVEKGISYHLTVPHTPQQNGVAERMIRTITEKARSMLNGRKLEKNFWGEAVLTATYIINRIPTNALLPLKKTPYEMWYNKKPQLKYLKVFGSVAYVHNKVRKNKFDEKSLKTIMVGYQPNGYKLWVEEKERFITARDVIFDEDKVSESRLVNAVNDKNCNKQIIDCKISNIPVCETGGERKSEVVESDCMPREMVENNENVKTLESVKSTNKTVNESGNHDFRLGSNKRNIESEIRKSKRIKELPIVSYKEDDIDNSLMSAQTCIEDIPKFFEEISVRPDKTSWEQAIKEELDAHVSNNTWSIVDKPKNKNIVDCKWVFTIKYNELGIPRKYKARLVARGFMQQYLLDFDETFAPVARVSSFRFLLALSNQFDLNIHHMDVKTAFLNGVLKEEIYMNIPQGVNCSGDKVCKLNKSIYGLKQAARCWYECFELALKEIGFTNSEVDKCIYILNKGDINKNIYVLLYVDDLVISTRNTEELKKFKTYVTSKFKMTDLMSIKYFIGIRIEQRDKIILLSQSSYIKRVLSKFNMEDCKPVDTPLLSSIDYEGLNSDEHYPAPCRQLIGCLMYIMTCTRPDISIAINVLSRYSNKNNKVLWQSLKRVLRYLKGTINLKLQYKQNLNYKNKIEGYTDSDWGGCLNDRRSTTGFIFRMFDNCSISWCTKKQTSVAASSTEAEYMALFEAVREALWIRSLAKSIDYEIKSPINIYEDNQGCISIVTSVSCHKRSKHIDIKYHFSREQVENKAIFINYITTAEQLADIFTKPLPTARYRDLRSQLGLTMDGFKNLSLN